MVFLTFFLAVITIVLMIMSPMTLQDITKQYVIEDGYMTILVPNKWLMRMIYLMVVFSPFHFQIIKGGNSVGRHPLLTNKQSRFMWVLMPTY